MSMLVTLGLTPTAASSTPSSSGTSSGSGLISSSTNPMVALSSSMIPRPIARPLVSSSVVQFHPKSSSTTTVLPLGSKSKVPNSAIIHSNNESSSISGTLSRRNKPSSHQNSTNSQKQFSKPNSTATTTLKSNHPTSTYEFLQCNSKRLKYLGYKLHVFLLSSIRWSVMILSGCMAGNMISTFLPLFFILCLCVGISIVFVAIMKTLAP